MKVRNPPKIATKVASKRGCRAVQGSTSRQSLAPERPVVQAFLRFQCLIFHIRGENLSNTIPNRVNSIVFYIML